MTATPSWFNGEIVHAHGVRIDPTERGFTLGDGAFETLPVFNGVPVLWARHMTRLMSALSLLGIAYPEPEISAAWSTYQNSVESAHGILRVTVTRGPGRRGLAGSDGTPSLLMTFSEWRPNTLFVPVALKTVSVRRNQHSPASSHKLTSYVDNVLAAREAAAAGADDALILNTDARPVCSSIANLFVVRGTSLITPPIDEGVLPGIMRSEVLAIADQFGMQPDERPLERAELDDADAAFLTNSVRLVRPVAAIDGTAFDTDDRVGGLFGRLCDRIGLLCQADVLAIDQGLGPE